MSILLNDIAITCLMDYLGVRLIEDDSQPFGYRCIKVEKL
jgi:hypothetical protein